MHLAPNVSLRMLPCTPKAKKAAPAPKKAAAPKKVEAVEEGPAEQVIDHPREQRTREFLAMSCQKHYSYYESGNCQYDV